MTVAVQVTKTSFDFGNGTLSLMVQSHWLCPVPGQGPEPEEWGTIDVGPCPYSGGVKDST